MTAESSDDNPAQRTGILGRLYEQFAIKKDNSIQYVSRIPNEISETTGLLPYSRATPSGPALGECETTWAKETLTLVTHTRSLAVTLLLQYSITIASIFFVGRIGKTELGAVSRRCFFQLFFFAPR
jgi:hypothetical protein